MKNHKTPFSDNMKYNPAELRTIVLTVLFLSMISILTLAIMDINRPLMIALAVVIVAASLLVFRGHIASGSWLTLIAALVALSTLVFSNNGIRDTAMMGLIVLLAGAGLLAGKTGTIVIGALVILEIVAYGTLESLGMLYSQFSDVNFFADYLALSISVSMITALQWLLINRLNTNIQNAEHELAERKKIQAQLEEAEALYRKLVESIPAAVYMAEPGIMGAWHFMSPRIFALTGYAPEEWTNDPGFWQSHVHPDDLEQALANESQALQEGKMPRLEYRFQKSNGEYVWFHDESLAILQANAQIVQGFLLDITEQKKAEEQLTRRIAELQAVHGISEKLIQRSDLQKLIHDTGEQIQHLLGANNLLIAIHDPNTNLIHFPYDFDQGILRRDAPIRFGEGMTTRVMEGKKPVIIENDWQRRAGEMNVINATSLPAKSSVSVPIMTTERVIGVISAENTEREYAFNANDAQLLMTIASNLAMAIEKTRLQDSIKNELEIQEKLVRELEMKNEELERFAYTASHDLKSPLITIRGFLGYIEEDARKGNFERLNSDIKRVSEATEKMHRLLTELLELSRVGRVANEKQKAPFDVIITEALKRVDGQLKQKQVLVRVGENFPTVYVDKERIVEVLQNLIDNAIKFMGQQPNPCIEINHQQMENGHAVFYVRDNGIGIRKEMHQRIFGLFDKLNPDTEGTGVGLALVKQIVEVHDGKVWVESEEGMGSTFFFTLGNSKA
ncbi:MAG: PAS domain-containing protein [Chloroflexi bacterium]|nr:PAS domain-containing protein [Chloroflexota bacterium]